MKIYTKKGNKNYKERRILKEIEDAIAANPQKAEQIVPASNWAELQALRNKIVTDDVDYEEISKSTENNTTENNMAKRPSKAQEDEDIDVDVIDDEQPTSSNNGAFIDPFNREEPIVRDYVYGDESMRKGGASEKTESKTFFAEPTDFTEAFEMPDDEEEQDNAKSSSKSTETKSNSRAETKKEPLNPRFEDMSSGKKKRSTQKFAKYIVEAVCTLSEKGFVWFANKDINDAKLAEYEMTGEMDLSLLVTLEDGQECTVKQFFQVQCMKAEQLAVIQEEQKKDLSDALAEVLMEKGVGPTPTQELLLITLSVLGGQALTLMTLKSQTNSLLTQLRAMKDEQPGYSAPRYEQPQQAAPSSETNAASQSVQVTEQEQEGDFSTLSLETAYDEDEIVIDNPIQTKE